MSSVRHEHALSGELRVSPRCGVKHRNDDGAGTAGARPVLSASYLTIVSQYVAPGKTPVSGQVAVCAN